MENINPRILGISAARKYGKNIGAFDLSLLVNSWPLLIGASEQASYLKCQDFADFRALVYVLNAMEFSAFTIVFETGPAGSGKVSVKMLTAAQISDKCRNDSKGSA